MSVSEFPARVQYLSIDADGKLFAFVGRQGDISFIYGGRLWPQKNNGYFKKFILGEKNSLFPRGRFQLDSLISGIF